MVSQQLSLVMVQGLTGITASGSGVVVKDNNNNAV
ncbi:MAG: hypothetical protein CM15mP58_11070 [Burkholderiaceae bacterium]|nr:MAG: hypothetical protein CM15mP58_11070 [Burkholderiaceae bacterium]